MIIENGKATHKEKPQKENQDYSLKTFRPKSLKEIVGRVKEKELILTMISSAKKQNKEGEPVVLDHILLYGPPGLGKTTLAHVIAREINANLKITSGPTLEKQSDIVALITGVSAGDIIFIDEIHRMRKPVSEILYSAMEDYALDVIVGDGAGAQTVRIDLPKFTLIGATTRIGLLTAPLRDRFGVQMRLDYYTIDNLCTLINNTAKKFNLVLEEDAVKLIAERSRGTARVAIRLFNRVKDYYFAHTSADNAISLKIASLGLEMVGVDQLGLDKIDRTILSVLHDKFQDTPVGIKTLAAATSEDEETIEDVYEPFLLRLGLIKRTPRGRLITPRGIEHITLKGNK